MISIQNISKQFHNRVAVSNLSFDVQSGEIMGLLGPNGAGKTTALRILAGYFPPSSGRVLIDGRDLWQDRIKSVSKVGYLPENTPLDPDLTTEEFLQYVFSLKKLPAKERIEIGTVLSVCGLEVVRSRLIKNLSKGFRQRIGLAQALLGNPSVLILDEPTVGLDPAQIIEIRALIRRFAKDRTVIISSHILPEVSALCSRVLIMSRGEVVASGKPDELAADIRQSGEIVIKARGDQVRALDLIQSILGVIAVRTDRMENQEFCLFIRHKKSTDLRAELSKRILESGCELLELKESPVSLEDVFMKIVIEEPRA